MNRRLWIPHSVIASCALIAAHRGAYAQQAAESSPTPAAVASTSASTNPAGEGDLDEIIIHGIRRGDLVLPTTVTSNSVYGLDLGVMDVPRNTTVISQAQLAALNIQNPGGGFLLS